MKCPLQNHLDTTKPGELTFSVSDCLEEECAWWEQTISECSISALAGRLDSIDRSLIDIKLKMPHEKQFRK